MSQDPALSAAPKGIELDPAKLQRLAAELLAEVDTNPRAVAERMAGAEAHLRLAMLNASPEMQEKLLSRAIELDPYRATTHWMAALDAHRKGQLGVALPHYQRAVLLAPEDREIRFHAGYAFLEAARHPSLTDEEAADLADAAADHFEAILVLEPSHTRAKLGALESALYGKMSKLRDTLKRLFARVPVEEALLPTMTRLFYQAIFAFRVGKAKNVDQKNKKTMSELAEVVKPWRDAFPDDPSLAGVLAAASAKCDTAEELCERIATLAVEIPDVRVLRMLLRERLADIPEPRRRLALFEEAMAKIPPLDGIAHDYMQLRHLVAKRAAAEGDLSSAREAWQKCLETDPDNPSTVQNLLRLARYAGDAKEIARLERHLDELWALYVDTSPRPEIILQRKAASLMLAHEEEGLELGAAIQQDKRPTVDLMRRRVRRFLHAQALARLAVEPALLAKTDMESKILLGATTDEVVAESLNILGLPSDVRLPVAYAYYAVPKDADTETLHKAREARHAPIREEIRVLIEQKQSADALVEEERKILAATEVLFHPATRAAYDAATCEAAQAEYYRRYANELRGLVDLSAGVSDTSFEPRESLAALLASAPRGTIAPYFEISSANEQWFQRGLLYIRFGGALRQAFELISAGQAAEVVRLCNEELADAMGLPDPYVLLTKAVLMDVNVPFWEALDRARESARKAVELGVSQRMLGYVMRLVSATKEGLAQLGAAERATALCNEGRTSEALQILWLGYWGDRKRKPPTETPMARIVQGLSPTGPAIFAFLMAQSIKQNTVQWFNDSKPAHPYARMEMERAAQGYIKHAIAWCNYAGERVAYDPNFKTSPAMQEMLEDLKALMSALERDLEALSK